VSEASENQRWVRVPSPGQIRGEGKWIHFEKLEAPKHVTWEWMLEYKYLPTHVGNTPPEPTQSMVAPGVPET
jgi:hypothetical protein